jgi:microcystin-dependent protein
LLESEIPAHNHTLRAVADTGDVSLPQDGAVLAATTGASGEVAPTPPLTPMRWNSLAPSGGGLPHNNMQPYLTLNFCIAMQGVYPPRT